MSNDSDNAIRAKLDAEAKAHNELVSEVVDVGVKSGLCGCNRENCRQQILWFEIKRLRAENARYREAQDRLLLASRNAWEWLDELRTAWMEGVFSEHDGKGGYRSNKNVDIEVALREAIDAASSTPEPKDGK